MSDSIIAYREPNIVAQFITLTKPRVNALIVFTAIIGMMLAYPVGFAWDVPLMLTATVGIWLVASAAAAFNCLVEEAIDRNMARTRARPTVAGSIRTWQIVLFMSIVGGIGLVILVHFVNALTMWLTLATFVGYAIIYTVILKPATPQNIVIGGASGAMPPVLGWAAVTGAVHPHSLLLFLIIFAWTPPHFWALALMANTDYHKAKVPMLPNVRGAAHTKVEIFIYTIVLVAMSLSLTPLHIMGLWYFIPAAILGGIFIYDAWRMFSGPTKPMARITFKYSLLYLALMCVAMVADRVIG